MKKVFNCEIHYFQSPHLSQIYDGFEKLRKQGVVKLTYKNVDGKETKPILRVIVDNKFTLIYDLIDGLHWFGLTTEEKLNHFKYNTKADFYFKRSYTNQLSNFAPKHCKVYPLGLNYPINAEGKFKVLKEIIVNTRLFKYLKPKYKGYPSESFEAIPALNDRNQIIFYAQLWNPDEVTNESSKIERKKINETRISIIRACKKEFGDSFRGGILANKYSETQCKDILATQEETKKLHYLKAVKASDICISTTGLHGSIGWQMGEYVAASKAIVTMPLNYELPGEFKIESNYLTFTTSEELINNIYFLIENKNLKYKIMKNNYNYYNTYLRPDVLVLNTLLRVYKDS